MLSKVIADLLADDRGYQVIQQLPGIGPVLAAVIITEIGDVHRFGSAAQLCSQSGLTPGHCESDTKVTRGHVTKQGSRMLLGGHRGRPAGTARLGDRRGQERHHRPPRKEARNIAKVAAARGRSPWSSTACATGRSAAWPRRRTLTPGPAASVSGMSSPLLASGQARGRVSVGAAALTPRRGRPLD